MNIERGKRILLERSPTVIDAVTRLWAAVRGAAFWVAALLPLSYVPLLYAAPITVVGLLKLVSLNVLALVVGHGYGSSGDDGRFGSDGQFGTDGRLDTDEQFGDDGANR